MRHIARTNIQITPIAMGCWPIVGITSIDVTREQSLATLNSAFEAGINFFDTAYCYGYAGESEQMIGQVFAEKRDQIVIASKGGIHWKDQKQIKDGRPETIKRECEESLQRLGTDRIDLHYLHAPDPKVSLTETAGAFQELLDEGKILSVGVSNFSFEQLKEFSKVLVPNAFQPHYNMLQREIEEDRLPWCIENDVSIMVYWPLMKGLLAGKLQRDHEFATKDGRRKYPMFHGEEWEKNQNFVDELREIANETGHSVPQVVLNWTIQRTGITAALCGAKRPEQIIDNAEAMTWELTAEHVARIDQAIKNRGPIISKAAV
ncbi:MAG: aldo/keto reductase [Planctomycetaceae bacterium]|jgi:aryl-alcohol dehydrogenase-like predicted oxidoreductase|nr:aldo/keto reductase [Planctomycetaceae bacterium]MDG2390989.1 aldo/keto reductase [Planctomycetaceae bacterium]